MKEKMAKFLQELYANLGLPANVLNLVAGAACVGLPEDADDAAIKARAEEASVKEMLQGFQAHADKRATDAAKAVEEKNKGDNKDTETKPGNDETPAWAKSFMEKQTETINSLTNEINALKTKSATQSFDEMVVRIGKEYKLEGEVLDLCKAGLSSDMDETAIRDALGKKAKVLKDSGASFGGGAQTDENQQKTQQEQWKNEEAEYIKNLPKE